MTNRTIKFRAWWHGVKRMKFFVMGDFEDTPEGWAMTFVQENEPHSIFLGKAELMQFTGLKDKNGKDIYEGDIMQWPDDSQENGFVIYEESGCQFRIAFKSEYSTSCHIGLNIGEKGRAVVIGNVFENPELLTK